MRLGEILIKVGLLTPEQLVQGLEAQVQYGGRLGTNLVELGYISEQQLAGTLSEQLGLPYVSTVLVGSISPSVIAMLPVEVASEYRVFPIARQGRTLHLCLCDPSNLDKLDALAFRLSCPVQPCVVTELTLNYALERYYGVRREPRFLRLKPQTSSAVATVRIVEERDGGSQGVGMSHADFLSAESGEFFHHGIEHLPDIGPALAEARTDADIVKCIKRYFGVAFDQCVVLSLRGSSLVLVGESGLGPDARLSPPMSMPLREDSVLPTAIRDLNLSFHKTTADPTLLELCRQTGMKIRNLTVVPVMQNRQARFLVVGGGLDLPGLEELLPSLKRILHQLSCAFQILSLRKQLLESPTAGPEARPRSG